MTTTASRRSVAKLPRFDPLATHVLDDPYQTYSELRAAGPVCRGGPGTWVVTRYAEVAELLRDHRLVGRLPDERDELSIWGTGAAAELSARILSRLEGRKHAGLRRVLADSFGGRQARRSVERLTDTVDDLLAPALDGEVLDAVRGFAFPLQAKTVCELIGMPPSERDEVWPCAMDLGRTFITFTVPSPDAVRRAEASVAHLRRIVHAALEERSRTPRDDVLTAMLEVADSGEDLDHDDVVDNVVFLFFAGFETTMNMVSNGFAALLAHPAEAARLHADRGLVPTAVDEFLRYDAPAQYAGRLVREPVEIDGFTIRAGRALHLLLGSANHDDRRFDQPDRLDVGRSPNPHVSFGGGAHHCIGRALAKLEGQVVFGRLFERAAALESAGPSIRLRHANFRAHEHLPVAIRPR